MLGVAADSAALQLVSPGSVAAALAVSVAVSLLVSWLRAPRYPRDVAWVGGGVGGWLAALGGMRAWIQAGYEAHSKRGRPFVVPGLLGSAPEVVVAPAHMGWLLDQPDARVSTAAAHYDILNGRYSFVDARILRDPYHERVVHAVLARRLGALVPALDDQVRRCVDDIFGVDDDHDGDDDAGWRTVNVWDAFMRLVPRVTHRVLVGRPLCDNADYVAAMVAFSEAVSRDLLVAPLVPAVFKPLVCRLLGLSSTRAYRRSARHTLPLIRRRLADMAAAAAAGDDDNKATPPPPDDYLTWHIAMATADGRADELAPERIAKRLLPLNFGAIHTTVITATAALLDMLAHDREQGIVGAVRAEAAAVRADLPDGGAWTKAGLARLHRLDSALRESMRHSAFSQTLVVRKVVARDGVADPATGARFARGTMLSCPLWGALHDADTYGESAGRYDAFRYSRAREAYYGDGERERARGSSPGEGLKVARMGMVTTSPEHYAFGHGRHACPGRFFVALELKLFFAYLFLNYDIKPLDERPKDRWLGKTLIPPTGATMQLRRKKGTRPVE